MVAGCFRGEYLARPAHANASGVSPCRSIGAISWSWLGRVRLSQACPAACLAKRFERAPRRKPADYTIRIGMGLVELAPDHIVSTTLYNGQFPGPLIRFKEGQRTLVDIYNDTDVPELVHWRGQMIPAMSMARRRKARPTCRRAACGGSASRRSLRVSASIALMSCLGLT